MCFLLAMESSFDTREKENAPIRQVNRAFEKSTIQIYRGLAFNFLSTRICKKKISSAVALPSRNPPLKRKQYVAGAFHGSMQPEVYIYEYAGWIEGAK